MKIMLKILLWIFFIIVGFFGGSVMFSKLIPEKLLGKDIEKEGRDGNPGAANVFMKCGPTLGFLCLFLDMAKGFLPVFIALRVLGYDSFMFSLVIAAPVLGHAIAPFNEFRGGKCISTAFGVVIALLPVTYAALILAFTYILFSTLIKIDPNRVRSIWAFSVFMAIAVPYLIYSSQYAIALGAVLLSVTAIVKHTKYFEEKHGQEKELESENTQCDEELPAEQNAK